MIVLFVSSAIWAAAFQTAAANDARTAFRACLKQASAEAKDQKVATDAFSAFARQKCSAQESGFKSAIWAFDSKNKMSKKESESNAEAQVEDFVATASDHYAADAPK
ncbi:hypothetical protein GCM10023264_27500 [Sphingomonas daechungensis]|uniref:Uncharacterized protein n=1 Tax=Sphingomonas daechungensis TaxID=1176646 RepID=A0ABX6T0M0_9SPHN|nr:hypothetical protein [Sphingomonas daechungensis]QNP43361.1 hypothetical protein H9L15_00340 [Sphingomonas daechungensis]